MGLVSSKCPCLEMSNENSSKGLPEPFYPTPQDQMSKAERAMKAALLIQRWYRRYCARLEVRRRYTWSIFQSIEYAGEQDQMKLHQFFNALLRHVAHDGRTSEVMEALSPRSSPTPYDGTNSAKSLVKKYNVDEMPVETSYRGIHLKFPLTTEGVHELIDSYKKKKLLHAKYAAKILKEGARELKKRPSVVHASTAISGQITVVGDLHGKLDDLLTVLYKNGLPSTDNPYVFNGDFVDRGKKSLEVLLILLSLVLAFPAEVYLNRGNHEDMVMNARYGFCKEVGRKYKGHNGPHILKLLEEVYRWLPFATVIDNKVLVVHGGISDSIDVNKLSTIDRSRYVSILRLPAENMTRSSSETSSGSDGDEAKRESGGTVSPDKMEEINEEWKQVLDLLWSDPHPSNGCVPNSFRGGGSYFGPNITQNFLYQHGYQLLIRSHECKIEGYEFMHNKMCLTIFSASNYYEEGSNKGAYVKLQGPSLECHIVQYMADPRKKNPTIRERVGRMESSAIRELKNQIVASKSAILRGFKECDPSNSGCISIADWVDVMDKQSHLGLPWRVLRDRLVTVDSSGKVKYLSTFNEEVVYKSPMKGGPTVVEALYRHKNSLEAIFRLIDKDNSGHISMDEFSEVCSLISKHVAVPLSQDDIVDLAKSIDINRDGFIDFNEFLECFRIVETQNQSQSGGNGQRDASNFGGDESDESDDG